MRNYILTAVAVLPLLLNVSHAAQSWAVDPPAPPFGFSSEESGTGAYLGVDIADVSSDRLDALKLKEEHGVEITMVDQDAPAGKAGIKEHDVILSMNETAIESKAQLQRMIHETPPGRIVTLGLSRDGKPLTVKLQLADRRKEFSFVAPKAKDFHIEMPPMPSLPDFDMPQINVVVVHSSARSGLMVESITPQLGEFLGVKNGNGVLIRSVEKGSRADKAGFHAGDVIIRINGEPVHDSSDFSRVLHAHGEGSIAVGVVRDKKELNLNLTLPARKESGEILEGSSDEPPLDAQSYLRLSELSNEIAKLRPQMEMASEDARKAVADMRKAMCDQQKKMQDESEKLKNQWGPQIREKLRNEIEHLQHETQGNGLEI